jgi:hypothetical protein
MDILRIRSRIQDFAASPSNVRFTEIDAFIRNQLIPAFGGKARPARGSHCTYTVGDQTFGITHHPGHIKKCYVKQFLERMVALNLYDPEE